MISKYCWTCVHLTSKPPPPIEYKLLSICFYLIPINTDKRLCSASLFTLPKFVYVLLHYIA